MKLLIDDRVVHYDDTGKGPVILLLHGWGSSLEIYHYLTSQLKDRYRLIRFDWPGFGGSELPAVPWGIDEFAGFAAAFCAKLGVEPEVLIGHSMGGQAAVHLVGAGQLKPGRLVLLAASAIRPGRGPREMLYLWLAKFGKAIVRGRWAGLLRRRLYRQTGTSDYLNSGPMQASYRKVVTNDQSDWARQIIIPTLLLWGDKDSDTPLERGKILAASIKGSQLEVIAGAGHYMFIDQPGRSAELIKAFLGTEYTRKPKDGSTGRKNA